MGIALLNIHLYAVKIYSYDLNVHLNAINFKIMTLDNQTIFFRGKKIILIKFFN